MASSPMSTSTSYNNQERIVSSFDEEPEASTATGVVASFLAAHLNLKRHDDLRTMLDSSKDGPKLDAMKRIVAMMAQGRDVSELFPQVVKNVVSKNIEVKKLVYVYLVRYAEEQQDLALLSISTFQRALKDPNQLIRASALRVLSSIRVPVIVPIMMISLKEAVTDMSPYVRKTAANAISKLYSLDPEHKDVLVEVIEKLLQDKTTLVAGSVVTAFEEVCPERIDLIHKNYRKLCNMLIDIDEWGQVVVMNMLTRYARTQFLDPNKNEQEQGGQKFYPSSEESEKSDDEEKTQEKKLSTFIMDSDHMLLLRSTKPLLQSRNASVVMAVAKLYHHCAPSNEVAIVIRALIRLLRSHREVQTVVLSNIATMSVSRKGLFEPYMKSFFVHSGDPTHIKLLKLEILTNIATQSNISTILREFQTYVTSADKQFAASTIQAIGRCASNIPEVTDTCLSGLVRLLSNRDESVVGESVVVMKKLLQMRPANHSEIIVHLSKLIDKINVPMARASILWLIGEYSDRIPKIAPDVLRKMAKSFISEEDIVKLQIINLGSKLYLTNPKQTKLLCQYVLQLSKYDQNYDIRDRARFVRLMLFPVENAGENGLRKKAKKLFLGEKPAPVLESIFKGREHFQLGSLSHMINTRASGYQDLPDFPEEQPDPAVRIVEVEQVWANQLLVGKSKKKDTFYSESEGSESDDDDEDESDEESEDDDEEEEDDDESEAEEEEEEEDSSDEEKVKVGNKEREESAEEEESEDDSEDEDEEESEEEDSDEDDEEDSEGPEEETPKAVAKEAKKVKTKDSSRNQRSYDQLLDLDDFGGDSSEVTPTASGSVLTPTLATDMESLSFTSKSYGHLSGGMTMDVIKTYELLNRISGQGLSAEYKFTRNPCIYSSSMVSVEVLFKNSGSRPISNLHVGGKRLSSGLKMEEFPEIDTLEPGESLSVSVGIDFRDTKQPANFDLCTEISKFSVSIKAPIGELTQRAPLSEEEFKSEQGKLTGMNESSLKFELPQAICNNKSICLRIQENANMALVPVAAATDDEIIVRFAGKLISSGVLVLLTVKSDKDGENSTVTVNCDKISVGSLLAKEIKTVLSKS